MTGGTGALDTHIAAVRQQLERRRWTFRNLPRMNALLGLARLRVNRRDVTTEWAKLLASAVTAEQNAWAPLQTIATRSVPARRC